MLHTKKLLVVFALLATSLAHADSIIGTLPVTLTNGTLADANQVMSNFNAIVTAVNTSAAANGANTSITSLGGLTTPITPAQGGSSVYTGSDAGSANAYSVSAATPLNYALRAGNTVNFIPASTNTGASTLTVAGTPAQAILRQTAAGLQALVGGEIFTGQVASVIYDGIQYELINNAVTANTQPCTSIDYAGITVPAGYLAEDGSAKSRTTFAALFSCLAYTSVSATLNGTTTVTVANGNLYQVGWFVGGANVTCNSVIQSVGATTIVLNNAAGASGASTLTIGPQPQGDCSTTFNLPNFQGRATVMADAAGSTLTSTTCTNPASIGTTCGSQSYTLLTANLPPYTPAGTITNGSLNNASGILTSGGAAASGYGGGVGTPVTITQNSSSFAGIAQGGTSTPLSVIQPIALVTKAIKF